MPAICSTVPTSSTSSVSNLAEIVNQRASPTNWTLRASRRNEMHSSRDAVTDSLRVRALVMCEAEFVARRSSIQYAHSVGADIAYQIVGDGPRDLVFVPGWISNLELVWELREYARFLDRLASFSRLILFDKRGTGLSDRVEGDVSLEERSDDIRAVMDAAASEHAA